MSDTQSHTALTDDDLRFALEDARTRHAALIDLLKFEDQKAMSLLSLYVTLGIATVGLALTYFGKDASITGYVAAGAIGAGSSLFMGSVFCFRSVKQVQLYLPGRGYEFWNAAFDHPTLTFRQLAEAYILHAIGSQDILRKANEEAAGELKAAKFFGIASPAVALAVGAGAYFLS